MNRNTILYRLVPIITSLAIMGGMILFYLSEGSFSQSLRDRLGWIIYDLRMAASLQNTAPDTQSLPVTIIDIDEHALNQFGHWPWPRNILAELTEKLVAQGAVVVAYDVLFAEEQNQAIKLIQQYQATLPAQSHTPFFNAIKSAVDGDTLFAESVKNNEVALSMVFSNSGFTKGTLHHPLAFSSADTRFINNLPKMNGYISSTKKLGNAANYTGFINAHPDEDGIMRRARLIQHHEGKVYPSLSLASSMAFLLADDVTLHSDQIGSQHYLYAIQLFDQMIPVDSNGDVLIPYIGPAHSFPYLSAADILNNKNVTSSIEGKVVLIGSTAASLSDFRATPINSLYPGVEAHASVINGIINNQFYAQPEWAHGINFMLIVAGGLLLSIALPYLSPSKQLFTVCLLLFTIIGFDYWLFITQNFIIDSVVPILTLLLIGVFNMGYGFLINNRDRLQLKAMFGQYIPPQLVDQMSKEPGKFAMEGERKEMTVLFADIRNFTSISETLTASELKKWLNAYFTPITEVIFNHNGTIDKYVGDMVMAFWGAPIDDSEHAYNSINAAQQMLKKTQELSREFSKEGHPEVEIGIGISSGSMNVGNMGSKYRRAYTVLGDQVNLGSRLESLTKFYGVQLIVSEKTKQLVGNRMEFLLLDRVRVKGKDKPVNIYEPITDTDKAEVAVYNRAITLYLNGSFEDAERIFKTLHKQRPSKPLYKLYEDRCNSLTQETPTHWEGVYTHTQK